LASVLLPLPDSRGADEHISVEQAWDQAISSIPLGALNGRMILAKL
jgi:hypothetical protein